MYDEERDKAWIVVWQRQFEGTPIQISMKNGRAAKNLIHHLEERAWAVIAINTLTGCVRDARDIQHPTW